MRLAKVALAATIMLAAGCSSMPQLTVGYYLPTVKTSVTVTQTAACNDAGVPFVTSETKFDSVYSRKEDGERKTLNLAQLDGWFTKSSMTVQLYEDGRLKSINGKQTGGGAEGIKTFVSLLPIVGLADFDLAQAKSACAELKKLLGEKDKTLTVVHKGQTSFDNAKSAFTLQQDSLPPNTYQKVAPIFGTNVVAEYETASPGIPHELDRDDQSLKLQLIEPARAIVKVHIIRANQETVAEEIVLVPQRGTPYPLPIQAPPVFGENTMELALGPAGNVEKLSYGGGGGAPGVSSSISDVLATYEDESAKDKAERVKAEADLIYQQQRLVQCRANPADCAK